MTSSPAGRARGLVTRTPAAPANVLAGGRPRLRVVPPILVRQLRGGFEESVHRGDITEVAADGRVVRSIGDPNRLVLLRSAAHPFGVVALIEAGGLDAFGLETAELALMAGSHSGEDVHVRTLQGVFRRATLTQALLACGAEGMPLDPLTSARLARDGEKAGAIRHMCSGQHAVAILLSKLNGWEMTGYWLPGHPAQVAMATAIARAFGITPNKLRSATDACGLPTWAVTLHEVARAFAMLAQPAAIPHDDARSSLAPALSLVRDAMLMHPDMVGGARDRLDTSLMKAAPGRLLSKSGGEGLRGVAILTGQHGSGPRQLASGLAVKIEDGGGNHRAGWAAAVEALRQVGALDAAGLRALGRYHRPGTRDSDGRMGGEAIPGFDLVPVGELVP